MVGNIDDGRIDRHSPIANAMVRCGRCILVVPVASRIVTAPDKAERSSRYAPIGQARGTDGDRPAIYVYS